MFGASVDKIVYKVFFKNFLSWKAKSVKIYLYLTIKSVKFHLLLLRNDNVTTGGHFYTFLQAFTYLTAKAIGRNAG